MIAVKTRTPDGRRQRARRPSPDWFHSRPRLERVEDRLLLSTFLVKNIADSGPGSLRQAILDSDAAGGSNTIDFAISGHGVRTIAPVSPLPAITSPVLIDGFSQPGYAATPLIAVTAPSSGGTDALAIGSNTTVRGVAVDGFTFGNGVASETLTVDSAPLAPIALGSPGAIDVYRIDTATEARLVAQVHAAGAVTRLLLKDAQGNLLMQSDGQSPANPDDLIDVSVPAGAVLLEVQHIAGAGEYTLSTTLTPATAPFQAIPVTSQPSAIVTGDFTGHGLSDIATTNLNTSDLSVSLSNSDGSFQPPQSYAVGKNPGSIVAGDFTGDGRLDLAVSDAIGIQILLGNGDGTFQPATTVIAGIGGSIVAGDFTGNRILDLAIADGSNNDVSVWLGRGDGTFRADGTYALGTSPRQIVAGDFTGTGILDLATCNLYASDVSVLLGNGDGTFQTPRTYPVASPPASIVAGDFAGNGITDLATANYFANNVSVLVGNGDGTFQPQRTYSAGSGPVFLVAGDFREDGRDDLATADAGTNAVSVLLANGDGTFQTQRTYTIGLYPYSLVTGDFQGDGRTDLATGNVGTSDISVLRGNGDGTFQTQVTRLVGLHPLSVVTGDFTNDGIVDLATANAYSNDVSVLLGHGDGTFQTQVPYAVGSYPLSLVSGDFNGDGIADLATANSSSNNVSILMGNGDGTFQPAVEYAVGKGPDHIVAGDFTGDGILDLAVANSGSNDVSILLGNGDGTFQPAMEYKVGTYPISIVAGDFTGGGHLDLAVANEGSNDVSVLLGNGDGTFQQERTYAVGKQPWNIVMGDLTGNGRLDLAVANLGAKNVSILIGNGDGTFQPQRTYAVGTKPISLVTGAYTGDGILDLAVANSGSNDVSILLGNGDGTFKPQIRYKLGSAPKSIVAGDFNGDGRTDLAITGSNNDVSVLLGNGDGTFINPNLLDTTARNDPLLADVTGAGTGDVLVVDGAGNILYRQAIPGHPGTFEPPVTVNPNNPSRDIAWLPSTDQGPVLASVDAHDDSISFYGYRDGGFVRLQGSLTTGRLPAQIIAAHLSRDGFTDLVVRNAGDGTVSVFFGTPFDRNQLVGPFDPQLVPPNFLPPVTLPVGLGVSDVQAVDTAGKGALDLVVTNKLTGQVSVLLNLGGKAFASPAPYRAGTGLSAIDSGGMPRVTSLEATGGVVAGAFTAGRPTSLVTINPGSNTLDVLAGLGGGRFANPVTLQTASPAKVVRSADFNQDGVPDLAVLSTNGLSLYLGNGKGGFAPPVTYAVGPQSNGLTVADVNHDGHLDLLVGDAYGDVLELMGQGDGTFQPYHEANQAIALAVADLTGKGSRDVIYADQGLDRVVVDYGGGQSTVLGDRSQGVLHPGAVALADVNGDGVPDLIVANSGSNNVLVYPGSGNGQFGPASNGGHGYFVGNNPVAIAVADLNGQPDLLVANAGSNDVSVLLGQGRGASWTLIPGPRIKTQGGPDALAVGTLTGTGTPDLFVANGQANTVEQFQGVGYGFFKQTPTAVYPVGQAPSAVFLGNFNELGQGLATLNAGSNDGTLITGLRSGNPQIQTFPTGGEQPTTAFAGDFTGSGFTDLVVGNTGNGHLALLLGGTGGLSLSQTLVSAEAPAPTGLSFAGVSGGVLNFYVSTAGRESALQMSFDLSGGAGSPEDVSTVVVTPSAVPSPSATLFQAASGSVQQVAQLIGLSDSTFDLAATLLTVSVIPSHTDSAPSSSSAGLGQGLGQAQGNDGSGGSGDSRAEPSTQAEGPETRLPAAGAPLPPLDRLSIGLERAWDRAHAALRDLKLEPEPVAGAPRDRSPEPAVGPRAAPPLPAPEQSRIRAPSQPAARSDAPAALPIATSSNSLDQRRQDTSRVLDAALEALATHREADGPAGRWGLGSWRELARGERTATSRTLVAAVASAAAVGTAWTLGARRISRRRLAATGLR
jgi:hypothetical protein